MVGEGQDEMIRWIMRGNAVDRCPQLYTMSCMHNDAVTPSWQAKL